jgi:DNA-binding transcriptional ArsR family regulator
LHIVHASPQSLQDTGKGAGASRHQDQLELKKRLDIDKVFKALADPGRRRLLDLLHRENGLTLTALCGDMDMTRQAVTQHLRLLEEANLVAVVWQGREKLHYLNPVPLHEIQERWIGKFERSRLDALRDFKKKLEGDDDEKA